MESPAAKNNTITIPLALTATILAQTFSVLLITICFVPFNISSKEVSVSVWSWLLSLSYSTSRILSLALTSSPTLQSSLSNHTSIYHIFYHHLSSFRTELNDFCFFALRVLLLQFNFAPSYKIQVCL